MPGIGEGQGLDGILARDGSPVQPDVPDLSLSEMLSLGDSVLANVLRRHVVLAGRPAGGSDTDHAKWASYSS